jgi:hypothetical protein
MSEEPKRRVLPDQPALKVVNKMAKIIDDSTPPLTVPQIKWALETLTALYTGELPDSAAKG